MRVKRGTDLPERGPIPPSNDNAAPAVSAARGQRYEIGDVLARGGMGVVHHAFDRLVKQPIAYKRLLVSLESQRASMTALFQREFDTLLRLEHPNIVRAHEYGFDATGPYYTMELLTGSDLAALAPLPYPEVCRIVRDVASALALIHTRGWIHRDVSPSNVRLTADGRAKLIDFGALVPFGQPSEVVGTPAFMAPECLTRESLDGRVDLYALGALTYWLLTRAAPVRALRLEQLPEALQQPLHAPSRHVPEVPPALDELVLSLLQHDRAARPRSAADVIERLTQIGQLAPEHDPREVAFSFLLHPPLVGRASAEHEIRRSMERLLAGHGEVVVIQAGHGLGRSALTEQFAVEAQLRGAHVLRAPGNAHGAPLAVAHKLLHDGLAVYQDVGRAGLEGRALRPDLGQARNAVEMAERQSRLVGSIEDALLHMAQRAPLVLLVDDAHLADPQSMALFASMLDSMARHALLLVLSWPAGRTLSDAEATLFARCHSIALAPLGEEDVASLVSRLFGSVPNAQRLALWLHSESGGNASLCLDLLRELLQRGDVRYQGGTFTLPSELERGLGGNTEKRWLDRLSSLSERARQLLCLLSLHEGTLPIEQLAAAMAEEPAQLLVAIDELQTQGMLTGASSGYGVASAALRVAVVAALSQVDERTMRRSLADVLLTAPSPTINQIYVAGQHLIRAGAEHELRGAQAIADAVRGITFEVAISVQATPYLESALEVLGRHGRSEVECLDLLIPLSVSGFYGHLSAQHRYLDRAMSALSRAAGLHLTRRLSRWLGARLALILGILYAVVRGLLWPRANGGRSTPRNIESLLGVAAAGTAAAAITFDSIEARRVTTWLKPFAASSVVGVQVGRDFCLATAAATAGKQVESAAAYARLIAHMSQPVPGLPERLREQLRIGAFHGRAHMCLELDPPFVLEAARELEQSGVFMASYGEALRMGYHAYRGDFESAELHRTRAEALGFRGGVSGAGMVTLALHTLHGSILTDNTLGVVRALAELERVASASPGVRVLRDIAQASLLRMRGHGAEALPIWERVLSSESARQHEYGLHARGWYARALSELGQHERARQVCTQSLLECRTDQGTLQPAAQLLTRQLALAEAGLGNHQRAATLLAELLQHAAAGGNPLELGLLHHDRAHVALLEREREVFDQHSTAAQQQFRATRNPWLLQVGDALVTRAVQAGLLPERASLSAREASAEDLDGSTEIAPLAASDDPARDVAKR